MNVIAAESALAMNGLIYANVQIPVIYARSKYLDGINNLKNQYVYVGEIDKTNYVYECNNVLIPTAERSIVDYIRYDKIMEEGNLIWAIQNYIEDHGEDMSKIYEVSDFYGVKRKIIDYWFNEARNDDDYSMG